MNDDDEVPYLATAAHIHDIDPADTNALEQFVREHYADAGEQFAGEQCVAAVAQRMRENRQRIAAEPMDEALQAVITVMGGRVELARSLGLKYRSVLDWRRVPVERLIQIERITGIPRQRLRPDVFEGAEKD
jgi:hypothetical protein